MLPSISGRDLELPVITVHLMLAMGWTAFFSGLALNLLYYLFHPSQVEMSPRNKLQALVKLFQRNEDFLTVQDDQIMMEKNKKIEDKHQEVDPP